VDGSAGSGKIGRQEGRKESEAASEYFGALAKCSIDGCCLLALHSSPFLNGNFPTDGCHSKSTTANCRHDVCTERNYGFKLWHKKVGIFLDKILYKAIPSLG